MESPKTLTKSQLIDILAERSALPRKRAEQVTQTIFQAMIDALAQKKRIEIRGFGSFAVKDYPAYTGRNPRTGAIVEVPEKSAVRFKVGKDLRELVNIDDADADAEKLTWPQPDARSWRQDDRRP